VHASTHLRHHLLVSNFDRWQSTREISLASSMIASVSSSLEKTIVKYIDETAPASGSTSTVAKIGPGELYVFRGCVLMPVADIGLTIGNEEAIDDE
jgi:hypothetical protein